MKTSGAALAVQTYTEKRRRRRRGTRKGRRKAGRGILGKCFNITSLTVTILPAHTATNKYGEQEAMPARLLERVCGCHFPSLSLKQPSPGAGGGAGRDTLLFRIRSGLVFVSNWFKIN